MLRKSFALRFLTFGLLVTILALVGGIVLRWAAQWGPEGLQAVVGA